MRTPTTGRGWGFRGGKTDEAGRGRSRSRVRFPYPDEEGNQQEILRAVEEHTRIADPPRSSERLPRPSAGGERGGEMLRFDLAMGLAYRDSAPVIRGHVTSPRSQSAHDEFSQCVLRARANLLL